jgi:transposase
VADAHDATRDADADVAIRRVAELEAALAAERKAWLAERQALTVERDNLRLAYDNLRLELELLRRRLFVAKAERVDTAQLELELAGKLAALDALNRELGLPPLDGDEPAGPDPRPNRDRRRPKPTGRRDLRDVDLPEERIELLDPELEATGTRIGWEECCQTRWRRASFVRLVTARAKYAAVDPPTSTTEDGAVPAETAAPRTTIITVPPPPQMIARSIGTPSLFAHIISQKFCDGLPFHRQQDQFSRLGLPIDRGTMCRWAEEIGATVGATVVEAMRAEAMRTAFCIMTDATGVLVQPIRDDPPARSATARRGHRACDRGHFFVQIADADHVFFEYLPRETSTAVAELFKGFSGYVQADAKSVYDLMFRPAAQRPPPDDGEPDLAERKEVGCWAHARRKAWEAAITLKDPVAREALLRIKRIFDLDRTWRGRPPDAIRALRELHLRPHTDAFFAWVADEYVRVKDHRGLLRTALGYAHRQREALTRFFEDGRLRLDNNASERELRRIAVGRKAWLFVGSDDHAQAAGNLLTLIASARLHRLDPEAYLRDLFCVLPQWRRDRYLELAPRYWTATRARLDEAELERELGIFTIPAPPTSSEQPASR